MSTVEPAVLRAVEGLLARSGRTLVVVGPPSSGKSTLLVKLRTGVESAGGRAVVIRGTFRGRSVPWGALEALDRRVDAEEEIPEEGSMPEEHGDDAIAPMAPVALDPESIGGSRRRDGRVRTTLLGGTARSRGPPARDADGYWQELLTEFQGDGAHPVVLIVEDAQFLDTESREFVVELSQRARFRPLLIALGLDSTASTAAVWEESLLGRSDVDWVRLTRHEPDPRELHRLRGLTEGLAPEALQAIGYVTLLGGETTGVVLARIARTSVKQLNAALRPTIELGLLRVREGRISVPDRASLPVLERLFPEADRRRWHFEIAEGLRALSAEPPLAQRIEIARHYLAAAPDARAMTRLLETAEISLTLQEFDAAARLLGEALDCLPSLPPADRTATEPEMHFLNARTLAACGCLAEAEKELGEGIEGALRAGKTANDLAGWLEPLLPTLQAIGPRPQLVTTIVELAERLHDAGLIEPEVLLETLLPGFDAERNLPDRSRAEALRAAQNAHRLKERHLQALGLFTMGVARVRGKPEEMLQAERFLRAARYLLRESRRWELDYVAAEFECRLMEAQGRIDQSLAVRQQNIPALERARLLPVQLLHELGIAEIYLDRGNAAAADAPLDRARKIADTLHLFPPSPALLRTWLLDGRRHAIAGTIVAARDRWSALADLPLTLGLPRLRAEALLRLALLEQEAGRWEEAQRVAARLADPGLLGLLPEGVRDWPADLAPHVTGTQHGGGLLAAVPPASRREPRPRRKRGSSPPAVPPD